jgi:hypothetical protein
VHPKVLGLEAWAVVRKLVRSERTSGWMLAGGTGLALQLRHLVSEDLDFFRAGAFDSEQLAVGLADLGRVAVQNRSAGTLHIRLEGLRVSFLAAQAPLLFPGTRYRGILVADPRDIAVMKVVAIGGRGSRKDFVDLYFCLRSGGGLDAVFEMVRRRFRAVDYKEYHLLRSLAFFEDADAEPMPKMLRRVSWTVIRRTIAAEVKRLS